MSVQNLLTTGNIAPSWQRREHDLYVIEKLIDAAEVNIGDDNVAVLFKIEKKVVILRAEIIVVTAEGGTLTVDLGTFSDAGTTEIDLDGLFDGVNCNATAGTIYSTLNYSQAGASPYALSAAAYFPGAYVAGSAAAPKYVCATYNDAADHAKLLFRLYVSDIAGL